MEQLQISLGEVTATAQQVRAVNEELMNHLLFMKKVINDLESSWQSPASSMLRTRFNAMLPVFENYRTIIEAYAKFLDQTVITYDALESSIHQQASAF